MKRYLACLCVLLAGSGVAQSGQPWWNTGWKQRIPITLKAGMSPGDDPVAAVKVADSSGEYALSSFRLIDNQGQEVPCVVRRDLQGDYFLGWRPGRLQILEKRQYHAYFSGEEKAAGPVPDAMPDELPGMNLIPNADFSRRDGNGDLLDWAFSSKGYGIKDPWTPENRNGLKPVLEDGRKALQFEGCLVVHVKVRSGRQYELCYEGKYAGEGLGITVWYRGRTIHEYLQKELQVGNYKMQTALSVQGVWQKVSASSFIYQDLKTGQPALNNLRLLTYTETAFLQITARGGPAWLAGISFSDITERGSLKIRTAEMECLK